MIAVTVEAAFINELGVTLVWLSLQITALCVVAAAVYGVARRGNPKVGATAALSSLLLVSALSVAAFAPGPSWMPHDDAAGEAAAQDEAGTGGDSKATAAPDRPRPAAAEVSWFSAEAVSTFAREFERRIQQPIELPAESWHWTGWVAVLFCLGLGIGCVRLVLGLVSVSRLRHSGKTVVDVTASELLGVICAEFSVTRSVALCQSDGVSSAATIGWLRPLVLLPSDWSSWSREELRTVLAHEVAHIAHRDFPCWLLAQVGLLLHFYHPLVHWLAGRLRLEQELAADVDAARHSGGAQKYLRNLAELAVRHADQPVAWPARTFLPSRGTLLRRVEMLRDRNTNRASPPWRRRATITAMLLAGIVLSGIRQQGNAVAQDEKATTLRQKARAEQSRAVLRAAEAKATARTLAKARAFDLRYVPASSAMVIGFRPASLAAHQELKPIIQMVEQENLKGMDLEVSDIEQVLMLGFQIDDSETSLNRRPVISMTLKADSKSTVDGVIKVAARSETTAKTHNGMKYVEVDNRPEAFYAPNPKTLIFGETDVVTWLMDATKDGPGKHIWADDFASVADHDFVYLMDVAAVRPEIRAKMGRSPGNPMLAAFSPLWEDTNLLVVGGTFTGGSLLTVKAVCGSEDGAKKVQQTAQSLIPLGRNMLDGAKQQLRRQPPQAQKMMADLIGFGEDLLGKVQVTQDGKTARLLMKSEEDSFPVFVAVLLPAVQSAREAARRMQSMNNLKQIGLAFHNYHAVHKKFPGPANVGPDGKTVHSWRVAILPFLEQQALYKQYKLDEPWDSEHNKKVLAQMPQTFRSPNATGDVTHTSYIGLSGATTGLGTGSGEKISSFVDGTSNTILVVGAQRNIPWTKPEDIPFEPEKELPKFGGFHHSGFLALLSDGSVRFIADAVDEAILKALITRNGKEVIPQF